MEPLIAADGQGTRMRALMPAPPKSLLLVGIGDNPILEHQLLWLRSLRFKEATLCLGYKIYAVRQYFDMERVRLISRGTT